MQVMPLIRPRGGRNCCWFIAMKLTLEFFGIGQSQQKIAT
jgi:hypothetical protein